MLIDEADRLRMASLEQVRAIFDEGQIGRSHRDAGAGEAAGALNRGVTSQAGHAAVPGGKEDSAGLSFQSARITNRQVCHGRLVWVRSSPSPTVSEKHPSGLPVGKASAGSGFQPAPAR